MIMVKKTSSEYYQQWKKNNPENYIKHKQKYTILRRINKQKAVEYLGGKCVHCGLQTNNYCVYDFHHIDQTQKDTGIGSIRGSWDKIVEELKKCILLCANCHRIEHSNKE